MRETMRKLLITNVSEFARATVCQEGRRVGSP
jgi:hypothetical protein